MEDEFLMKCVVDTAKRSFYLYSNEGDEKVVDCDTVEEFMNVLNFGRSPLIWCSLPKTTGTDKKGH